MTNVLVTGATGNVGRAVRKHLAAYPAVRAVAAVRRVAAARAADGAGHYVAFDFTRPAGHAAALEGIDYVFLLRPPALANVDRYFAPFVSACKEGGVRGLVFLSVQGVETSRMIPHHGIERLLRASGLGYVFLRPGYFMQNLTTTLYPGIRAHREIVLPAGRAAFNWVDVDNVGEVAARALADFAAHRERVYVLTGSESKSFGEATAAVSAVLTRPITYRSVNPVSFYIRQRRAGVPRGKVLVLLALHFLPRFQTTPPLTRTYTQITGKPPTTLRAFARRERELLDAGGGGSITVK